MATRFEVDHEGIRRFEERDPELNAVLAAYARLAVSFAQRIAPVGEPEDDDEHPGQYRDAMYYEKIDNGPGWTFGNSDNKAHWIEYGAAHIRRHSVLARAAAILSGEEFASFG